MAIVRSHGSVAGQAVRLANPAVERSLRAWEERVEKAEEAAYQRAKQELAAEYEERIRKAEARAEAAETSLAERIAECHAQHEERWGQLLQSLAAVSEDLENLRSASVAAAEGEVLRLAIALAGTILHRDMAESAQWIADVLAPVLGDLPARHGILIRMHPEDAAAAEEQLALALQRMELPPERPRILADDVLAPGSCRVECAGTVVDCGLPGAWQRVGSHLLEQAPSQDLSQEWSAPRTADNDD